MFEGSVGVHFPVQAVVLDLFEGFVEVCFPVQAVVPDSFADFVEFCFLEQVVALCLVQDFGVVLRCSGQGLEKLVLKRKGQ